VRGDDDGVEEEQRAVGAGLGGVDVERGPGHPALAHRARQRGLVHDPAARGVDDPHLRLDHPQLTVAEQADGLGALGQVDADEIGLGEQLAQAGQAYAQLAGPGRRHVGVIGDHRHAEGGETLGHQHADLAQAEDSGHLAVQHHPGERGPLPLAALERGHGLGHVPGQRQQQRHRVLGGADDIGGRRVHDHDPGPRSGLDIHVVQANSGAGHDAQPGRAGERLGVDDRGAAHDDRLGVG
jgi:hypothetical protein